MKLFDIEDNNKFNIQQISAEPLPSKAEFERIVTKSKDPCEKLLDRSFHELIRRNKIAYEVSIFSPAAFQELWDALLKGKHGMRKSRAGRVTQYKNIPLAAIQNLFPTTFHLLPLVELLNGTLAQLIIQTLNNEANHILNNLENNSEIPDNSPQKDGKKKPYGYWKNFDNLIYEIVIFINDFYKFLPPEIPDDELRIKILEALRNNSLTFPSTFILDKHKRRDLRTAIQDFGGIIAVKKRLKIPIPSKETLGKKKKSPKPYAYWKIWMNFISELLSFINELYEFLPLSTPEAEIHSKVLKALQDGKLSLPSSGTYRKQGRLDIEQAFWYFGGMAGVKKRIKIKNISKYKQPTKPRGYWQNCDNVVAEFLTFLKKYHKLPPKMRPEVVIKLLQIGQIEVPSVNTIKEIRGDDLLNGIRNFGGLFKLKEKFQIPSNVKPPGYWQNWDNFLSELFYFILIFNHIDPEREIDQKFILKALRNNKLTFPKMKDMEASGFHSLRSAFRDFGGIHKVKERLNVYSSTKPPGYWQSWENIDLELEEIIQELGHFPSKGDLQRLGREDDLYTAIRKYFGGLIKVRLLKGYDLEDAETKSSRYRYYHRRGIKTEELVIGLLKEWADLNKFEYSTQDQTRVGTGLLEFVCGENKNYGVDVTNAKNWNTIREKWEERKYHEHLDELWVIVVANHPSRIYQMLNEESPDNVLVIDYREIVSFLNGLNTQKIPFEIPPKKLRKLKALAQCTFYNRKEILRKLKAEEQQKKMEDYDK